MSRSQQIELLARLRPGSAELRAAAGPWQARWAGDGARADRVVRPGAHGHLWLARVEGKDVKLTTEVALAGGFGGRLQPQMSGADTPADMTARLAKRGVAVPAD